MFYKPEKPQVVVQNFIKTDIDILRHVLVPSWIEIAKG